MRNLSKIIVITLLLSACGDLLILLMIVFRLEYEHLLRTKNRKEIESGYISYYDDGVEN